MRSKANALFDRDIDDQRLVVTSSEFFGANEEEFIPLNEEEMNTKIVSRAIPQPAQTPGAEGSSVPAIAKFKKPGNSLSSLFKTIYFNTDQYTPNAATSKMDMQKLATYLKKHPSTYIFVEGHCDERASESYNLALGTKRAGAIRTILVNYGANPNQLYSISYGKERPAVAGKSKAVFAKNRRVEFKIYDGHNK
ncbi:MAG: Peptidoglycan-associated lipoprotein [Chlamydiia bacterium]|nr:Peptidoglycan-associated lipoprotein [Chlamydiia bacterium]MCH9618554.1 Peptidoglycan-associated lipoprotein [Chlamydiia bacterium]MCH9624262.1 Peptidoglycan-associated lipoprotein [Chlamydiia bacterium]